MPLITITTNFPQVAQAYDAMLRDVRDKAMASTINKVADQAKTRMGRAITAEFNVSAGYVRDRLRVRRATSKAGQLQLSADLIGGNGKRLSANVIAFAEKKVTLAQARKRTKAGTLSRLFVKIKRTGGPKPLNSRSFIGNAGRTVFEREGKVRLPIRAVQTIDIPSMFNTKRINLAVQQFIREKLPAVWVNEAAFFMRKAGGG